MAFYRNFWDAVALVATTYISISKNTTSVSGSGNQFCPGGFANFGDSLTDTGNTLNAFPYSTDAEYSPYGETFFGAPAKRYSDGRVVPDFISLAFRVPLLVPYFGMAPLDHSSGVNFAAGGATAVINPSASVPFSLPVQVAQFVRFKSSAMAVKSDHACSNFSNGLPGKASFSSWLYTIEIGGNDILLPLLNGLTAEQIIATVIPAAITNIITAVQNLYAQSARRFLIFGIPAMGCSTIILTRYAGVGVVTDNVGCMVPVNDIIQVFNGALLGAIQVLRTQLSRTTFSYFDYYTANMEILQNASTYGFDPSKIFTACCGAQSQATSLNYNPSIGCGHTDQGSSNCANPDKYVIWDGIHFTDHFYRVISEFVLKGKFTDNPVNYAANCSLDLSKFGPIVTYKEAYPSSCANLVH